MIFADEIGSVGFDTNVEAVLAGLRDEIAALRERVAYLEGQTPRHVGRLQ